MLKSTDQGQNDKNKRLWAIIRRIAEKMGVKPGELANRSTCPLPLIEAGFNGEPVPVSLYLRRFAEVLNLTSGRGGSGRSIDNLSDEEVERLYIDWSDDVQPSLWSD